jgi:CheY-like chemotaxis protein
MNPINSRMCSSQVPTATSRTILFVEDEDFLRTVIADVLTGAGYHVLSASNGVEATEARAQYHGPVHLLLTDFCMPLKNGEILADR